jgi:hypothetical protein
MTRRESGRKYGPKFAFPFFVTWRTFWPSAPETKISSSVGRTSPLARRFL